MEAAWAPNVDKPARRLLYADLGSPPRRGSLHQVAARTRWPGAPTEPTAFYLDALDRCLDDGILEPSEQDWLDRTAEVLGLSKQDRTQLHNQYYELLERPDPRRRDRD